jgi:hypothetical protein
MQGASKTAKSWASGRRDALAYAWQPERGGGAWVNPGRLRFLCLHKLTIPGRRSKTESLGYLLNLERRSVSRYSKHWSCVNSHAR